MSESVGILGGKVPEIQASSETSERLNAWLSLQKEGEIAQAEASVAEKSALVDLQADKVQKLVTKEVGDVTGIFSNANIIEVRNNFHHLRNPDLADAYTELTVRQQDVMLAEEQCIKTDEHEAAIAFADSINPHLFREVAFGEVLTAAKAFSNIERVKDKNRQEAIYGDRWIQQYLDYHREMKGCMSDLKKLGYNPKSKKQSEVYQLIAQEAKAFNFSIAPKDSKTSETLGRERARSFKELELLAKKDSTAVAQSLRRHGFKSLPSSWDDRSFSTSQIVRLCEAAREAFEKQ